VVVALEQGDLEEIDITAILGLIQSQGGLKGQDFNLYC
jgi:hypothetical protein